MKRVVITKSDTDSREREELAFQIIAASAPIMKRTVEGTKRKVSTREAWEINIRDARVVDFIDETIRKEEG